MAEVGSCHVDSLPRVSRETGDQSGRRIEADVSRETGLGLKPALQLDACWGVFVFHRRGGSRKQVGPV